ncbi:MAG TPA: ATP-binding protein [Clostridiaceae bacterium]|nr:ATP-binding protein [Clostridiaceae bacterium]
MKSKIINREQGINFLKRWCNQPIIKVVSGVRRSGKSTLFDIFRTQLLNDGISEEQIQTINFEDMKNHELTDPKLLHKYILDNIVVDAMNYIFLDEIQYVEEFEKVINSLLLIKNTDLYITGSNAYFLRGDLATRLTGRYVEYKLLPLSFKEYYEWHRQNTDIPDAAESTKKILFEKYLQGTFPFILFLTERKQILDYLQGIYSTVVLYDIVERLSVKDVRLLERLIQTLFSSIGSPVSINKLKNTMVSKGFSISNNTIDRYLSGILDSLIMYEARRFDIKDKALLETQAKYYAVDLGLRSLILPDHFQDYGHIIENVIYLELLRRGNEVFVGKTNNYEVDFVSVNSQKEIEYYQVALTTLDEAVLARELRSLQAIADQYPKYLLTLDDYNQEANYAGIKKLNIINWLLG